MSALITMKVAGDVNQFRRWIENEDQLREIADRAKAAGAIHHRFGIGDGFVLVVDEWDSAEQFQTFFGAAEIQTVVGEMGAQGEPRITFANAKVFPGQF